MTTKTFEELGREADRANRTFLRARDHLIRLGSAESVANLLDVKFTKADWDNGLIDLGNALKAVIVVRLEELLPAALEVLQRQGNDATAALKAAFDRPPGADAHAPLVPRALQTSPEQEQLDPVQGLGAAASPPAPPSTGNTPTGPGPGVEPHLRDQVLEIDRWSIMDRQAQELLAWVHQNPGKRLSKTPQRTQLEAAGYLSSIGTPPNNTWTLSDLGAEVVREHLTDIAAE
jgi:hypothetical protein